MNKYFENKVILSNEISILKLAYCIYKDYGIRKNCNWFWKGKPLRGNDVIVRLTSVVTTKLHWTGQPDQ